VPLGVAAGRWAWTAFANSIGVVPATVVPACRWAWTAFANSIGVVPATVVPVPALVLGIAGLLAAGNLLAAGPAAVAARTPPAAALRAE
jgi:hypothetical protein